MTHIKTWQERLEGRVSAGITMQLQMNQQAMQAEIADLRAQLAARIEPVLSGVNLDVIARSYDWTIDQHGELLGVTSGDMGYISTGIKIVGDTLAIWNDGVSCIGGHSPQQPIAQPAPSVPDGMREFVGAIANNYNHIDREDDERMCSGCSGLIDYDASANEFVEHHRPECIVLRAKAMLAAAPKNDGGE